MSEFSNSIVALRPYDESILDHVSMYDHIPYKRDDNLCNREALCLVSGNVIKCYRFIGSQPFELDNQDELINRKIEKLHRQRQLALHKEEVACSNQLTEEQLKDLVEDNG